jgi:predicted metal-dependent phosphotriesterase family hydrolase
MPVTSLLTWCLTLPRMIEQVFRLGGVQIVAATGNHLPVPRTFGNVSPDVIAPFHVKKVEEGIEETEIKNARQIKVASDRGGITRPPEVVIRSAAYTHLLTVIPISTLT